VRRRSIVTVTLLGALVLGGPVGAVTLFIANRAPAAVAPSPPAEAGISAAEMTAQLEKLSKRWNCSKTVQIFADISLYDPAVGLDCFHPDESVSFLRVYQHRSTVGRVLQEWSPTFGRGRVWTRGAHWVFMGTKSDSGPFAQLADLPATSSAPPVVGTEPRDAARDTCMSLLFATAYDRVTSAPAVSQTMNELDKQFAGARKALESTVTREIIGELVVQDDENIRASLSRYGPEYRSVCETVT